MKSINPPVFRNKFRHNNKPSEKKIAKLKKQSEMSYSEEPHYLGCRCADCSKTRVWSSGE